MISSVSLALVCAALLFAAPQIPDRPQVQQPPPAPAAAPVVRPGAPAPPKPIEPPILPRDARQLVDQSGGQLIRQLQELHAAYLRDQRPDDAAAVLAQIKLLQKVTGIPDDPSQQIPPTKVYMNQYRDRVGQMFVFTVTGSADEVVWGTGVYTDDTALEGAAVHAGLLRSGQTGEVHVTVLPGQTSYAATRKNGIDSLSASASGGSYSLGRTAASNVARPTSISAFRGRVGELLTVPVVGAASGSVWGSDIYTDDSSIPAAAVHAGILRVGEFGFVQVSMAEGEGAYLGTNRNGIASQDYGAFQGSFRLTRAPQPWALRLPDDVQDTSGMVTLSQLRKETGVSFSLKVMGAPGVVRGSDIYTDDSSIGAAAVHAGVLKLGETGWVRVTILPGQDAYAASDQNGVKGAEGGKWAGSFRVDKGTKPR